VFKSKPSINADTDSSGAASSSASASSSSSAGSVVRKPKHEHVRKSPTLAHSLTFVASLSENRISLKHFDEKKFSTIVQLVLEHMLAICRGSQPIVGAKLAVAAENVATRLAKFTLICQEVGFCVWVRCEVCVAPEYGDVFL
jgi:hypothetical protein